MDNVTSPLAPLPPESVTETTGWVANGIPPGPPPGLVAKVSWLTPPRLTCTALLTTELSPGAEAVNV